MMILSTTMLILFTLTASWGVLINSVLMALAGAFNCGPGFYTWYVFLWNYGKINDLLCFMLVSYLVLF